jgi:hypothetical protein
MRKSALLVLVCSACTEASDAPPTEPADHFESGERIKVRAKTTTITTADGALRASTEFAGWFDSERNEPCSPTLASDGKTRCLPPAVLLSDGYYFADAACTIPVALVVGCTPEVPRYVATPAAASCPAATTGPRVFAAGPAITSYYFKDGATCSAQPANPDWTWWPPTGDEVPASSFAEMTVETTTQP